MRELGPRAGPAAASGHAARLRWARPGGDGGSRREGGGEVGAGGGPGRGGRAGDRLPSGGRAAPPRVPQPWLIAFRLALRRQP